MVFERDSKNMSMFHVVERWMWRIFKSIAFTTITWVLQIGIADVIELR